jgi:hypothetical protein
MNWLAISCDTQEGARKFSACSSWERRRPRLPVSNLAKNIFLSLLIKTDLVLFRAGRRGRLRSQDERAQKRPAVFHGPKSSI